METVTPASSSRVARYKGRKYRLLFLGETKFGPRAHLQFMDETQDFWCDGKLVREVFEPKKSKTVDGGKIATPDPAAKASA